jgi:hypothetical protein
MRQCARVLLAWLISFSRASALPLAMVCSKAWSAR